MLNEELLKRGSEKPNIGCDVTFSIVAENVSGSFKYELKATVSKDIETGKTFSVLGALCSRKRKSARRVMLEYGVGEMKKQGSEDPILADCRKGFLYPLTSKGNTHLRSRKHLERLIGRMKMG